MTSKKDLEREATTYVVSQQTLGITGFYYIQKLMNEEKTDLYRVTKFESTEKKMWCDCPGFVIQKYAKIDHKHIQMVMAYQKLGSPASVIYKLGPKNQVIHVMTVD